jgi:D-alanine transaminase
MKKWNATRAPAGRIAYVNGRYLPHGEAQVHVEDRGVQFGDAVYEAFNMVGGRMLDREEHLDRLERSLRLLEMHMPMGRAALKLVMAEMVRRNSLRDGVLYMQISRGALRRDHPIPDKPPRPTLIFTARAIAPAAVAAKYRDGVKAITLPDERWARRDIKTTQLLPNLLARTAAKRAGALEAVLFDGDGFVTEGAVTSFWIVDSEGNIVTRDLSPAILPGVTRRVMLEAAAEAQVTIIERKFTVSEAKNAREAFLSSASGAAVPVVMIDGQAIGDGRPGPITRRIHELYARKAGMEVQEFN